MSYYSYKVEHDLGLAPNPFGEYCTLAVCKPKIRNSKNLHYGDWIIGTGSKKLNRLHHLIFLMQVEEKITFEQYWDDHRFQYKKPVLNGSLAQMYGDNIYHRNPKTNEWIQENSAHSLKDGCINEDHLKVDVSGKYVLISKIFYYFGDNSFVIPERFIEVCSEGRSVKSTSIPEEIAKEFVEWIQDKYPIGIYGDPIDWKNHK